VAHLFAKQIKSTTQKICIEILGLLYLHFKLTFRQYKYIFRDKNSASLFCLKVENFGHIVLLKSHYPLFQ